MRIIRVKCRTAGELSDDKKNVWETTGARIKAARKKAGLTQEELAGKLGIPFQSISQWERNVRNPKIASLYKLSCVLGCGIEKLVDPRDFE